MKNYIMKICSLAILCIVAGGCEKDGSAGDKPHEEPESELPENVFDETVTQYFTETAPAYIRVSSDIPAELVPDEGDVIVCLATENTPYGYLGRIIEIEQTSGGYVWHTERAALTDAFETLHVDESVDAMENVEEMVDETGKRYDFEFVDNSIWDEINPADDGEDDNPDEEPETKAGAGGYADATIRLPLDDIEVAGGTLSGSIYISARIDLAIDISNWKLQYTNLEVTPRVGMDMEFNADISVGESITLFEHSFPLGVITVGYVVLSPELHVELSAGFDGEIKVEASMKNEFMNMKYYIRYDNGEWKKGCKDQTIAEGNRCRAASLEMSGELYTEATCGLTVGLYSADMIGISLDAVGRHSIKGEYSLSDKDLFKANSKVGIERTLHGELTFYTDFIGEAADFEKTVETGNLLLGVTPVNLFPEVFDLAAELKDKVIGVTSDWDTDDNLLSGEYGIVLLDDNHQPVEYRKLGSIAAPTLTKVPGNGGNTSFEVDRAGNYIVAPYVEHKGQQYLGEEVEVKSDVINPWRVYDKLLKSCEYGNDLRHEFVYDEYGRLTQVTEYDYAFNDHAVVNLLYDGNTITITDAPGDYDYGINITITMDENGYLLNYVDKNGYLGDSYLMEYNAEGYLKNNFWDIPHLENIWEDGNLISGSTLAMEGDTYTYIDKENKVNMYFYNPEILIIGGGFKGHVSRNLPASWTWSMGTSTYEYTFDDEGYVTTMIEHYRGRYPDGEALNYDQEFRLTYYE